jgi:subtilase family serine protease
VADEPLAAVSFYTVSPNSTYEIYVYTDVTSGPRSGSIAGSATGSINLAGYHTITLPPGISLNAGQKFSIVIRLTTPGNTCPIPVETQVIGYTSNATANAGESYTSSDGNGWSDLVSWWPNTNVCLKAFSAYPTPKPDLVVTEINAVPASPVAGQTVNITVSVHNQGTSAADAFKVDFYKSLISEPAGFQTGDFSCNSTVLAAGAATTCTGEVSYPAVGFYKMWAQVDTRQQISESLEGNNTLAQAITIADSPDLTISSLNGPSTVLPDVAFVLTDTTKNSGVVSAPATITGYYRSTDCTWSADDIFLPSRPVGALSPGASHTGSVSVTIPASIAGTVYVIAKADSSDILAESNEANNMSCKSYTFLPDLVIASLTGPATITAGTTITLTDTTKNSGTTPSPAASTSYYLSSDSIWSADDILLASRPVGALTAGATNTGSTSVTIPPSAAGTVYLIAKADGANVVTESKETNNTNSKSYTLRPDLAVASIAGPSTAVPGATITLTDVTQNLGKASAPATATSYYLSTNSTWSTDDVLLASRAVGYLAVGATNAGSVQVTIPGSASGVVYIIAGADSADVVEEISESNNTRYKSYTFKPNLAISSLTGPSKTSPGATIILTDITKNSGTTSAPATTTNYYLSMNNTWSADDTLLTSRAVQPLAAGATDAGSVFVTIPPSATGTIYIIAKADGANEVAESSETDNIKSKTYKFLPDLIVSSVTGPDIAAAGTSITFTDITKNSGVTSAPATSTSYYLSTNATWSADDVLLASRAVGPLAAGATSTGSVSTTTPTAGTYYIIVKADDSNATEESSKTNNTKYRQFVASP